MLQRVTHRRVAERYETARTVKTLSRRPIDGTREILYNALMCVLCMSVCVRVCDRL